MRDRQCPTISIAAMIRDARECGSSFTHELDINRVFKARDAAFDLGIERDTPEMDGHLGQYGMTRWPHVCLDDFRWWDARRWCHQLGLDNGNALHWVIFGAWLGIPTEPCLGGPWTWEGTSHKECRRKVARMLGAPQGLCAQRR